ncbi:MAG: cysteine peptidase family C39 domain-containing protein [Cyanobacteria bacterium P01_H01_bin.121]
MLLTIAMFTALVLGFYVGERLWKVGVRLDHQIQTSSTVGVLVAASVVGLVVLILLLRDPSNTWIPNVIPLYAGEYWSEVAIWCGLFLLGTLTVLITHQARRKVFALCLTTLLLGTPLVYLANQLLPIAGQIRASRVEGNLVFQTTPYTCAAASIATIARLTGQAPEITEKEVAELVKTNQMGTTALAQLHGLETLGFEPKYERGLTLDDLKQLPSPVLMHVLEPVIGGRIAHAVVLLGVDPAAEAIIIANPLSGLQVKPFKELQDYWRGEVIWLT